MCFVTKYLLIATRKKKKANAKIMGRQKFIYFELFLFILFENNGKTKQYTLKKKLNLFLANKKKKKTDKTNIANQTKKLNK